MLTTLAVAGYRSLRDFAVTLEALNLVTGPNGSGKSNLYRALRLLARRWGRRRQSDMTGRGGNGRSGSELGSGGAGELGEPVVIRAIGANPNGPFASVPPAPPPLLNSPAPQLSSLIAGEQASEPSVPFHAHQRVIRIEMIDVVTRHQLVLHEDCRRGRAAAEEVEGEADHAFAVSFREVAY